MRSADSIVPICSSVGSTVADRIATIVIRGHAKHSKPSKSVDQAHTRPIVRPRHRRNPATQSMTRLIALGDNEPQASQAPTPTTRLPMTALSRGIQFEVMQRVESPKKACGRHPTEFESVQRMRKSHSATRGVSRRRRRLAPGGRYAVSGTY